MRNSPVVFCDDGEEMEVGSTEVEAPVVEMSVCRFEVRRLGSSLFCFLFCFVHPHPDTTVNFLICFKKINNENSHQTGPNQDSLSVDPHTKRRTVGSLCVFIY